ncbi:hypothetical protein FSPOR_9993 [Fusarium sporotrichioides]|uniref:Uncharacterized protein n=1 Tax=Fusarium sporotrichioides TaxID=5514 RepID=A0A395RN01_FUSSP|nr:hypothetical protein FSPOR_9993 [Fusarium sporotrichioides]
MGVGKYDEFSDVELEHTALQTRSLDPTPRQESQEHTSLKLGNISSYTPIEEVDVTSSGDEDDLVFVEPQMVDAAIEFASTSRTARLDKRSHRKTKFSKDSPLLVFDDTDMIEVAEDRDPEQDYLEHFAKLDRPNLSGYDIPIGPFESEEYEQGLRVDSQVSLFHKIPGVHTAQRALSASTRLAQSGIGNVTESFAYTAQRTREARQYFADSVFEAGQGLMFRIQESWATWPRGVNGGIQTLSQLLMEGVQSLPPSDTIIRPQGRQMHG